MVLVHESGIVVSHIIVRQEVPFLKFQLHFRGSSTNGRFDINLRF